MPTPALDPWGIAQPYDPYANQTVYYSSSPTPALSVNALSFAGVDRTGVTSSSLGLQAAIDYAASLTPKGAVFIPRGKYLMGRRYQVGSIGFAVGVVIPSGVSVYGEGPGTEIHDATPFSYANTEYADGPDGYYFHRIFALSGSDNEIWGLRFTGLNGDRDGVGFEPGENFQNACIGTTTPSPATPENGHRDINIHDCMFQNFYGFSFQDLTAYALRTNFYNNKCRYTANGLNTGASYSSHSGNEFWAAEGIEAAGDFLDISNNNMAGEYLLGISVYGDGLKLNNNTLDGSLLTGAVSSPGLLAGISLTGCHLSTCNNNVVMDCPTVGITVNEDTFGYTPHGIRRASDISLNGNIVSNFRTAGPTGAKMLLIRGADNITINGGSCAAPGDGELYAGDIGIYLQGTSSVSVNNVAVTGTRFAGIAAEGGNSNLTVSNCKCTGNLGSGITAAAVSNLQFIGNTSTGSFGDLIISSSCTFVRLSANQCGNVVIDPTGVKFEEGNSWQD